MGGTAKENRRFVEAVLSRYRAGIPCYDEAIDQARAGHIEQTSERRLPLISRLIENDISPGKALEVLKRGPFEYPEPLASIYQLYRSLMVEKNALDFVGLIAEALDLLESRLGVRRQIQRIYPYVCVDEFQDTNLSQYKILRHLVNAKTKSR